MTDTTAGIGHNGGPPLGHLSAQSAIAGFEAKLPPTTYRDVAAVIHDFVVGLKGELAQVISDAMPRIPLVRGIAIKACIAVVNVVLDGADNAFAAWAAKKGTLA